MISRYGSLDSSDGGEAQRTSLTAHYFKNLNGGQVHAHAYAFNNQLSLWNDFTHFLNEPVYGDQAAQQEGRNTIGGGVSYQHAAPILALENTALVGVETRNDFINVTRLPTKQRQVIPAAAAPADFREDDRVRLNALSVDAQSATRWNDWLRTVLGVRYDAIYGNDAGTQAGIASGQLLAPKVSLFSGRWLPPNCT